MKNLILVSIILTTSIAWAGKDRGGGDPLLIQAVEFSDQVKLREAIDVAALNFDVVAPSLAEMFRRETNDLLAKKYFLVLPSILVHRFSELKDYEDLKDVHNFYELGGYTDPALGAPIYFSERVEQYPVVELAANVTHEILHHILPDNLNEEQFVRDLTAAVIYSQNNKYIQSSLRSGLVIRSDYVSGRGLALLLKADLKGGLGFTGHYQRVRELTIDEFSTFKEMMAADNLYKVSSCDVITSIQGSMSGMIIPSLGVSMRYTNRIFYDIVQKANPKSRYLRIDKKGRKSVETCVKAKSSFFGWRCLEHVSFGQIFN